MTIGAGPLLDASLRRAAHLSAAASARAFALSDLPDLVLPPSSNGAADQAQLRAIAVLYLASELETAGIIPAAEDLTRLARTGALSVDLGGAARLVEAFWSGRQERASAEERRSLFGGLFGASDQASTAGGANTEFEDRLIDLCEALYKIDEQASNTSWGGVAQQVRVRHTARLLLDNLLGHTSGLPVFFAQELLASIRAALGLLDHPSVKAAFGARGVRDVVAAVQRRLSNRTTGGFDLRVRRGQSGMTILAWLADAAPLLDQTSGQPLLALDHPVIPAAVDWLETSLALSDAASTGDATAQRPVPAGRTGAAVTAA